MELTKQEKLKLIDYFEFQRDNEASKPLDEMNLELIDSYVKILLTLQDKHIELSSEFVNEQVRKLFNQKERDTAPETVKTTKKNINKKKVWLVAACIAILVALFSLVSIASEWDVFDALKNKFGTVLNAPVGIEQQENGISFFHLGKARMYSNIKDVLNQENLDVLYCDDYPGDLDIVSINTNIIDEKERIIFTFNDEKLNCIIDINQNLPQNVSDNYDETFEINGLQCYVINMQDVGLVQVYFNHHNNAYSFTYSDKQTILTIIENLEELQ